MLVRQVVFDDAMMFLNAQGGQSDLCDFQSDGQSLPLDQCVQTDPQLHYQNRSLSKILECLFPPLSLSVFC